MVTRGVGPAIDRQSATLRELVQDRLQQQIVAGALPAGSRLNETEIASELQVSRGPVREAIQRLASDGLIVIEPHRGARVRSFTDGEVSEMFELRLALETHAARLAARNGTDAFHRKVTQVLDKASAIVLSAAEPHYPVRPDIHQAILTGCGVPRIERAIVALHKELALARARSGWAPQRAKAAVREHRAIVRAVIAGDEQAAADAMYEHLQAAWAHTRPDIVNC